MVPSCIISILALELSLAATSYAHSHSSPYYRDQKPFSCAGENAGGMLLQSDLAREGWEAHCQSSNSSLRLRPPENGVCGLDAAEISMPSGHDREAVQNPVKSDNSPGQYIHLLYPMSPLTLHSESKSPTMKY